jgi:hypothetical protein
MIEDISVSNSPFYAAYIKEKSVIDAAIEKAVYDSAKNLTEEQLKDMFSIRGYAIAAQNAA